MIRLRSLSSTALSTKMLIISATSSFRMARLSKRILDSYQELKIYQEQDKSLLPAISAIFDAIVDQRPLSFSYRKPGEKVEEYKVFPISDL